jgi:hypothetical protein
LTFEEIPKGLKLLNSHYREAVEFSDKKVSKEID